jgi:hypothetical protein
MRFSLPEKIKGNHRSGNVDIHTSGNDHDLSEIDDENRA